jgi:hypothetical protein
VELTVRLVLLYHLTFLYIFGKKSGVCLFQRESEKASEVGEKTDEKKKKKYIKCGPMKIKCHVTANKKPHDCIVLIKQRVFD